MQDCVSRTQQLAARRSSNRFFPSTHFPFFFSSAVLPSRSRPPEAPASSSPVFLLFHLIIGFLSVNIDKH